MSRVSLFKILYKRANLKTNFYITIMKNHQKLLLVTLQSFVLLLTFTGPVAAQYDDPKVYYFYQRTIYLEDLLKPGAWWSNPSLISSIDRTTIFTSTTGMIGRQYSISSVRALFPVRPRLNAGFGLTGTATGAGAGGTGTNSGFSYQSYFNFTRPSIEAGISYIPPYLGTVGAMVLTGSKSYVPDYALADSNTRIISFFYGMSAGWISPALFKTVSLSLSMLSLYNAETNPWWEHCAKVGVVFTVLDSIVRGSVEYGFATDSVSGSLFSNPNNTTNYEALKGSLSIRFMGIAGLILGYSTDTRNFSDNGATYHMGLELRKSEVYPYYGGYEMAISTSNHISVFHQIWVGFNIKKAS